jgi:predicted AlkP superfamily phosphohydrolase/phosphomutase
MLGKLGYLAAGGQPSPEPGLEQNEEGDASGPRFDPVKALRDLLPKDFRKALARKLPTKLRDALAKRVDTADIDWSRTRAFCLPTDLEGCIRINLKGREPMGIVEPGEEYRALLAEITAELRALTDPATGRPVVREVILTDEAFPGVRRQHLPDLIILWDTSAPITALTSPKAGTVEGASPDTRPGTHAAPGFTLLSGPGLPTGTIQNGGHIYDLAPSLLARMGVAVPAHMQGTVWPEMTAKTEK